MLLASLADGHSVEQILQDFPSPGFELVFAWRRAEANRLDREDQFVETVRAHANEALSTWGQIL